MIKVNGIEFNVDTMDLDVAEKIEKEMNLVIKKIKNTKVESRTEGIKEIYNTVANCFNNVLGKGAADKIFKGKKNLLLALNCFEEFANSIKESDIQTGNELENMKNRYSPNRAKRRDTHKNKKKNRNR